MLYELLMSPALRTVLSEFATSLLPKLWGHILYMITEQDAAQVKAIVNFFFGFFALFGSCQTTFL